MSLQSWDHDKHDNDFHPLKETIFKDVPPDRTAVDNILRLNYGNQLRLTLMADTKANIMITVSSIVFSICLANMNSPGLTLPLSILGICSTISLIFAIIVIMPKIDYPKDEHGQIDTDSPFFNPLFFGHFAHIPIMDYKEAYKERLMKDEFIIDALVSDIYGIGRVIATNKFKYLRYSYITFLIGLAGTIGSFLIINHTDLLELLNSFNIFHVIKGEIDFTIEGFKHLLCSGSVKCRDG
jgi:hypothetical protein|tara:strand:- start:1266 stop:1982 length:717 start_codon:yes stop_codon:yes gene_type:complete